MKMNKFNFKDKFILALYEFNKQNRSFKYNRLKIYKYNKNEI